MKGPKMITGTIYGVRSLVLAFLVLHSPNVPTYPAPRLPVFDLWFDSDCVAYCDVISVVLNSDEQRSMLSVTRVLKQSETEIPDVINVFTFVGHESDPHMFEPHERALVFLRFDEEQLVYRPVSQSESVIPMDAESLQVYENRLDLLSDIEQAPGEEQRLRDLVLWCVECARHPIMRGDAAFGLSSLRNLEKNRNDPISEAQKAELVRILTAEETPGLSAASIVSLLQSYSSHDLDAFLMNSLRKCHQPAWLEIAKIAVYALPERMDVELDLETRNRLEQYTEVRRELLRLANLETNPKTQSAITLLRDEANIVWGWICCEVWNQCRRSSGQ